MLPSDKTMLTSCMVEFLERRLVGWGLYGGDLQQSRFHAYLICRFGDIPVPVTHLGMHIVTVGSQSSPEGWVEYFMYLGAVQLHGWVHTLRRVLLTDFDANAVHSFFEPGVALMLSAWSGIYP